MRVAIVSKALVHHAYHSKLEELARLGVDVHAIIPHRFEGESLGTVAQPDFGLIRKRLFFHSSHHVSFYIGLERTLRAVDPDILHVEDEPYNLAAYQAVAASPTRHNLLFAWQNIFKEYPFPFSALRRKTLASCQSAIAGNETAARVLRAAGFGGSVDVFPQFGVDPNAYRPRQRQQRRNLHVGFLGRLVAEKGIDILLRAVIGLPIQVYVYGDGPQRAALGAQAARDGVPLHLHPRLPSQQVPQALADLDMLVLPSVSTPRWREQFGRVLIEAMACEVAVVGSSCGEIPRVIGDAGLVFDEGDASDLRAKLEHLIAHPRLREELGKRGRQHVLQHYTQRRIAERTYRVYQSMLSAPHTGRPSATAR
jgi:glycosyltransferase involved in cell wall biosynthesis